MVVGVDRALRSCRFVSKAENRGLRGSLSESVLHVIHASIFTDHEVVSTLPLCFFGIARAFPAYTSPLSTPPSSVTLTTAYHGVQPASCLHVSCGLSSTELLSTAQSTARVLGRQALRKLPLFPASPSIKKFSGKKPQTNSLNFS